jgi:hypothetical protein
MLAMFIELDSSDYQSSSSIQLNIPAEIQCIAAIDHSLDYESAGNGRDRGWSCVVITAPGVLVRRFFDLAVTGAPGTAGACPSKRVQRSADSGQGGEPDRIATGIPGSDRAKAKVVVVGEAGSQDPPYDTVCL